MRRPFMNKKSFVLLFVIFISSVSFIYANSGSNKVAVLYNGRSQVNRNVLHFMGSEFQMRGTPYRFEAFEKTINKKPQDYKAVLVLNTGYRTGMDPVLSDFINSWKDKSEIILINIVKGSRDISVTEVPASKNPAGVDAVSAASLWRSSGLSFFKSSSPLQMHEQWVGDVLNMIDNRK